MRFLKVQNEWVVFKNNCFFFENETIVFENDRKTKKKRLTTLSFSRVHVYKVSIKG